MNAVPALRRRLAAVAPGRGTARAVMRKPQPLAEGRRNQEFLPAHLEILVTPASPHASFWLWTLCAVLAAGLAWSCFTTVDIHAVASGRVETDGRSKVLQPFETSRVKAIRTANGASVRAGDILIELEPTAAIADVLASRSTLESLDAQIARRKAVIAAVRTGQAPTDSPAAPASTGSVEEAAAMKADLAKVLAARDTLAAQIDEKTATENRYAASIVARKRLVAALGERQAMRQTLVQRRAGTRAAVIDATQQVEQAAADLAYDTGQLAEAGAAKRSLQRRIDEVTSQTLAEQTQALADAVGKRSAAVQSVVKAEYRLRQTVLTAPIDGTVQQLAVTTVGQVVTAGQPLLVTVPSDASVAVAALVPSQDIGFVTEGQQATLKLDAFPFSRYGTLAGAVEQVSRDAVDPRSANGSGDTIALAKGGGIAEDTGTPETRNLMFPVRIALDQRSIEAEGRMVPLTPGMTATVAIRTGNRRLIAYMFAPVVDSLTAVRRAP